VRLQHIPILAQDMLLPATNYVKASPFFVREKLGKVPRWGGGVFVTALDRRRLVRTEICSFMSSLGNDPEICGHVDNRKQFFGYCQMREYSLSYLLTTI
jgi:hypothetical protein